jgi:hypothetical protein
MYAVDPRAVLNELAAFDSSTGGPCEDACGMLLPASPYVGASAFTWPAALFLWVPVREATCTGIIASSSSWRSTDPSGSGNAHVNGGPRAVLVRADAWHEVNARGTDVLIAFVDPESELGAALAQRTASDVSPVPMATVAQWRTQLGDSASLTAARMEPWMIGTLLSDRRPPSIDHRVKRVLRDLPNRLAEATGKVACGVMEKG